MKKKFYSAAMLSVLSLMALSCQKESDYASESIIEESISMNTIHYTLNGVTYTVQINGEEDYSSLIERLLALAKLGQNVTFWRGESNCFASQSKEVVTYTTTSEKAAVAWAKNMADDGYSVNISYNEKTGIYTCTAIK